VSANADFVALHVTLAPSVMRAGLLGNRVFALEIRFLFTLQSLYYRLRVTGSQGSIPECPQVADSAETKLAS
jgi:hypothetical protein